MIYKFGNYSHDRILTLNAKDGDEFIKTNFSQRIPGTPIMQGLSGLKFIQCNLVNCAVPEGSVIENGNTTQISRCSHIHKDWPLPACPEECEHVLSVDEIEIDGVVLDRIYHRRDKIIV